MARDFTSGTCTNSARAPKAKIWPITSSEEVVAFQSHSGSGECCQRSGSLNFSINPRRSKDRDGKPGIGLIVYKRSIASRHSLIFAKASASLVTAYRKISAPKYIDVQSPSLSESAKNPLLRFPFSMPDSEALKPFLM